MSSKNIFNTEKSTIVVKNISKLYRIGEFLDRPDTLMRIFTDSITSPFKNFHRLKSLSKFEENDKSVLKALNDISFTLCKGETMGIVGRNGAGKSTLLKILSRVTEPTSGTAVISGRVGSLLEVGTGFHPELTGRENIYLSGTIFGMKKSEIDEKFEDIVEFSEIEKFIDTPIKRYSSGMKVRLGFSVAAHLEPEIMIIDEVLAVGDNTFQEKCIQKIDSLKNQGLTILFVSHNMAAVQSVCKKAMLIEQGNKIAEGTSNEIIELYRERSQMKLSVGSFSKENSDYEKVRIDGFRMLNNNDEETAEINFGERIKIEISITANEPIDDPMINFGLRRSDGISICNFSNFFDNFRLGTVKGSVKLTGYLPPLRLVPGFYEVWILAWPWGGGHKTGDMKTLQPYTYEVLPPVRVTGINLNQHDGVFQIPAEKWIYSDGKNDVVFDNINSENINNALADLE